MEEEKKRSGKRNEKAELGEILRKSWFHLRLSVRHPSRVPTWDAIILTAASPQQAHLYEWQLARAKRLGRIADSTITLVVPDPHACRIGSGAATLNAILALAKHFHSHLKSKDSFGASALHEPSNIEVSSLMVIEVSSLMVNFLSKKHILLLHAGGDSKRVPWANPMGKAFLPLPYLAAEDPDGSVPLLFDHILAISSCARQAFNWMTLFSSAVAG